MFNLKLIEFEKILLLAVGILCLVAVGMEINLIFENGLKEVGELLFSLFLIAFWLLLVMYLYNSFYLSIETEEDYYQ